MQAAVNAEMQVAENAEMTPVVVFIAGRKVKTTGEGWAVVADWNSTRQAR